MNPLNNQQQGQQAQPQATEPAAAPETIHVMVRNRKQVLFEDDVTAITSRNDTGIFDVLPEHSNFISVIKEKVLLRKSNGENYEIILSNGIMKVKNNSVKCYIDLIAPEINK